MRATTNNTAAAAAAAKTARGLLDNIAIFISDSWVIRLKEVQRGSHSANCKAGTEDAS